MEQYFVSDSVNEKLKIKLLPNEWFIRWVANKTPLSEYQTEKDFMFKITEKYVNKTGNDYAYLGQEFHPDIKFVHFTHSSNKNHMSGKTMRFLNRTTRKFKKDGNYYSYGGTSVFVKDKRFKATVDHFCSTPLFYSDRFISPSFNEIVKAEIKHGTELTEDKLTTGQIKYLKRHTVAPGTIYNQIKRVEEDWLGFLNQDLIEYDMDEEYERFSYLLDLYKDRDITVALSGGRDSAWLAMFLQHRGYNPNLVHITSPNNMNGIDDICCDRYRKEMNWKIKDFTVNYISDIFEEKDEVFTEFWPDKIYPLKSHSVKQYDGIKMSGEASESDHWKKTKWMYDLGITDDDTFITNYVKDMFNNRVYYGRGMDNYDERFWRVKDESLDYIYEYYRNIIRELKDHPLKHTTFWIPSYMDDCITNHKI